MGRHHALKPSHLYLPPPTYSSPSLLFSFRPSYFASPAAFLHETSTSALAVGDRIPGFKVSAGRLSICAPFTLHPLLLAPAAFLSSLHSNIFIDIESSYESTTSNIPDLLRPACSRAPIPSSASTASISRDDVAPSNALKLSEASSVSELQSTKPREHALAEDGLPILKTYPATDVDSRVEALHLIADSVAQQRTMASTTLIYHPVTMALIVGLFAVLRQTMYTGDKFDYLKIGMIWMGLTMALLGAIRYASGPYIEEAERVGTWKWLDRGRSREEEDSSGYRVLGEEDEILLTKFGVEEIAAIVFRAVQPLSPPSSPGSRKTRRSNDISRSTKLQIRGWMVKQKYRRKGVGAALLEDAIKFGAERGWTNGGVEFAPDHANHRRVLPEMLNGKFNEQDRVAHRILESKLDELDVGNKGRRKR